MNKLKRGFGFIVLMFFLFGCDTLVNNNCDESSIREKNYMHSIEKSFSNSIELDWVPCERYGIVKTKITIEDTLLYKLHKTILKDKILRWAYLTIIDSSSNKRYLQTYDPENNSFNKINVEYIER